MKSLACSLFLILAFAAPSNAQFWEPTADKAKLVEGRILVVELDDFECNPDIVEHLKKHWKLNTEIIGKSAEDLNSFLQPGISDKYLVLTGDAHQEYRTVQGKNEYAEVQSITLYPGEYAGQRNNAELGREWIVKLGLPSCLSSEEEVVFLSSFMEAHVNAMKNKPNSKNKKKSKLDPALTILLSGKTLLIPDEVTEVEESDIAKYYKSPSKLANRGEIKSAINRKQKGMAYLTVVWSDHKFMWVLAAVDCETNTILAVSKFQNYKPNFTKKGYDSETQFLSIYRSKSKVTLSEIKWLGKEVTKAKSAR